MAELIPSILTNNKKELEEKLQALSGLVERVHIDIIDGIFVDNLTITPEIVMGINTDLKIDFHLMVSDPVNWIQRCGDAGADRIIAQIENIQDQKDFLGKVAEIGIDCGFALDLSTPIEDIDDYLLKNLDLVLVMGVKAGFGGQGFNSSCQDKVKDLNKIRRKDPTPFKICVDGGVTAEVAKNLVGNGANEIVVGKRLWEGVLDNNIEEFNKKINA